MVYQEAQRWLDWQQSFLHSPVQPSLEQTNNIPLVINVNLMGRWMGA